MRSRLILGVVVVVLLIGGVIAAITLSGKEPVSTDGADDLEAVQTEIDAGAYESARVKLEAIIAEDEQNGEAHFKLGLVLFNMGDLALARQHFSRSMELEPERAAAVHHNLGVLAYQSGDLADAQSEFQAALSEDPTDPDTHYQLGATYLIQAYPMGALEPDETLLQQAAGEFERALELAPGKPEAQVGLANVEMLRGEMTAAIGLLEEAIATSPTMREALFALGRSYAAVGDTVKARTTLRQFLDTDPPTMWAQQAEEILAELGEE
ncbi:MAG: tetratricopeptide repeat protein [Anaerolineae bacterium]|jgi:tetratricopeptide (TPR) repeat protein|nr:tetratricopeptide repeat protein [Anaerolineae bacterium]